MSKAKSNKETGKKPKHIEQLAKRIRDLRIAKGYTSQETFAYARNLPRAQYGRYESGTDIRYSSLIKVAAAFDMTLEEFFSEGFE